MPSSLTFWICRISFCCDVISCIVIDMVLGGVAQIKTIPQVEAAMGFFVLVGPDSYDVTDFETKCGVGMNVTFLNDDICFNIV